MRAIITAVIYFTRDVCAEDVFDESGKSILKRPSVIRDAFASADRQISLFSEFHPSFIVKVLQRLLIGNKINNMKKLVCYLLIAGIALISGGANAHMLSVDHHSHEVSSASDHEYNVHIHEEKFTAESSTTLADSSKLDANYLETLTQAHYSHGHSHHHASGLPASCDLLAAVEPQSLKPVSYLPFVSSAISNNIERPKWLVTTHPVVSLLS